MSLIVLAPASILMVINYCNLFIYYLYTLLISYSRGVKFLIMILKMKFWKLERRLSLCWQTYGLHLYFIIDNHV